MDIIYKGNHYDRNNYNVFLKKHVNNSYNNKTMLIMRRTPDLIYAICMCFERNNTVIPIDPAYPKKHIQYIIKDSAPDEIISDVDSYDDLFQGKQSNITQNDVAYILYTSGSTGSPKGVEVTYEALSNFIEGISETINFSPGKRIACLTTISFDIFFLESIVALNKGLTVVLADEEEQRNPKLMAKFIQDNAVDMIQMTPSRMQLLLNYDKELTCLKRVKEIMIGGEAFPFGLFQTLQEKTTARIYNMYGPTETTIWSTISNLTYKDHIDIGRPIKNTEIYIMDDSLTLLPSGQVGEICIAGKGLAKGYVGRDDLTAEKFIYLPQKTNTRVYRTGDMGRILPDGNLEYLGRTDNQVKIRGHRIELEEIELQLNQFDGIKQSVVIASEINETDKILEAFYTSENSIEPKEISDYLSAKLPEYMIPVRFKHVESFILTTNGKIDRRNVLECAEIKAGGSISENLRIDELNNIQRKAFEVIVSTLPPQIEEISLETNFSNTGIDSVTFIKIVVALESEFDFQFDDEMLLITVFPTIKSMIDYIELKILQEME